MSTAVHLALASLPPARRQILEHLKRHGEAGVESVAAALSVTISGARQQLVALERDGLIAHQMLREGAGRPRHSYQLTPAGDALFPRRYADLANELLDYADGEDPALVARLFERRGARRLAEARVRLQGLPFGEQVRELARILDQDGYLADFTLRDDGVYVITEHNCAVLSVAQRYSHACSSEWTFLQAALPRATVRRVAHQLVSGHVCAYEIWPNTSSGPVAEAL